MSHVTTVSTDIVFNDEALLIEALNDCEGTVEHTVFDYYGKGQKVDYSIHTREFTRGIGFNKVGNHYEVRVDYFGKHEQGASLLKKIQMKYQKVSALKRVKAMGYSVKVGESENNIRIQATVY